MTDIKRIVELDEPEASLARHALKFYMHAKGKEVSPNSERLEAKLDQFLTDTTFTVSQVESINSIFAARAGTKGGASTSDAKKAAAAVNGAKGGRPRKPNLFIKFHRSVWGEPDQKLLAELERLTGRRDWLPEPGSKGGPYVRVHVEEFTPKLEKLLRNSLNVWSWDDEKGLHVYCLEHKTEDCTELRAAQKDREYPCLVCSRPSLWMY